MQAQAPSTLTDLFEHHPGVVLADEHDDPHIIHFITSQVKALKRAGVKTAFIEMFDNSATSHNLVSQFNEDGLFSDDMKKWFDAQRNPPRTTSDYECLMKELYAEGIHIVALDQEHRHTITPIKSSNAHWAGVVHKTMKDRAGKYVLFGGKYHTHLANNYECNDVVDQAEGIDKTLQIPCVVFYPRPAAQLLTEPKLFQDTSYSDGSQTYHLRIPQRQSELQAARF